MQTVKYEQLSQLQRDALDAASEVMENSYNPYSHFYVGATLIAQNEQLISGTNFENAAYGSTICAERSAVLRARDGHTKIQRHCHYRSW